MIPRKGNSAQSSEWTLSKKISVRLIQKIENDIIQILNPELHWRPFISRRRGPTETLLITIRLL